MGMPPGNNPLPPPGQKPKPQPEPCTPQPPAEPAKDDL